MHISIESLELLPQELKIVREQVRRMAFEKWRQSGCPSNDSLHFWLEAEREWVERDYAPHRDDLAAR